jgi:hypothetical protein
LVIARLAARIPVVKVNCWPSQAGGTNDMEYPMKLFRLFLVLLAVGFSPSSSALATLGDISCRAWVADRATHSFTEHTDEVWLTGVITGMVLNAGVDVLKDTDDDSFYLWMDKYCKRNPSGTVSMGASVLFKELQKKMSRP